MDRATRVLLCVGIVAIGVDILISGSFDGAQATLPAMALAVVTSLALGLRRPWRWRAATQNDGALPATPRPRCKMESPPRKPSLPGMPPKQLAKSAASSAAGPTTGAGEVALAEDEPCVDARAAGAADGAHARSEEAEAEEAALAAEQELGSVTCATVSAVVAAVARHAPSGGATIDRWAARRLAVARRGDVPAAVQLWAEGREWRAEPRAAEAANEAQVAAVDGCEPAPRASGASSEPPYRLMHHTEGEKHARARRTISIANYPLPSSRSRGKDVEGL